MLLFIVIATLTVSLASLLGLLFLIKSQFLLEKTVFLLVSLSTGVLFGGAFFHLLPEAIELSGAQSAFLIVVITFSCLFLFEKLLFWHHCHDENCSEHPAGTLNLITDAIHNFIDGMIIAGAFLVNLKLGLVTTLAIMIHEVPQELGDLGVLLHSGFSKKSAVFYNFLIALTSVFGGIIGYFFIGSTANVLSVLLPIAAGGFIYISTTDLIPELKKEHTKHKFFSAFALFFVGLTAMYFLIGF